MKTIVALMKKEAFQQLLGLTVFLLICLYVFCGLTYLFRNDGYDRRHIVGIKSEENNIDAVYVGGSAAFVYWQPLRAWRDCGFTSYSMATDSVQAEMLQAYIKEAEKYHDPQLYIIDARAFQYYTDDPSESGIRNGADSMDITSLNRYQLLNEYFRHRNTDKNTDIVSYYIDLAKYHSNTERLASEVSWGFLHNTGTSPEKGWEWIERYECLEKPKDFQTEERAILPDNALDSLYKLIEYCKRVEKETLFVVCPYEISKEDYAKYNAVKEVVEKAGFKFLNANDYYDEMQIDFSKDFYNNAHVNAFGAEKYTKFLEKYICDNYEMPDHRGDVAYNAWDTGAERFFREEGLITQSITNLRLTYEKGEALEEALKCAKSFSEWDNLVSDSRYFLLVTSVGDLEWPTGIADNKVLNKWNINESSKNIINIIANSRVLYTNAGTTDTSRIGSEGLPYTIDLNEKTVEIFDERIPIKEDKINVVLVDLMYMRVVEKAILDVTPDGIVVTEQ